MKILILLAVLILSSYSMKVELEYIHHKDLEGLDMPLKITKLPTLNQSSPLTPDELSTDTHFISSLPTPSPLKIRHDYIGTLYWGEVGMIITTRYQLGLDWNWVNAAGCFTCTGIDNQGFLPEESDTWEDEDMDKQIEFYERKVKGYVGRDTVEDDNDTPVNIQFIVATSTENLSEEKIAGAIGLAAASQHGEETYVTKLKNVGLIDAEEFTFYLDKDGIEKSYIWFGSNQDDQSEVTWADLVGYPEKEAIASWSVMAESAKAGETEFELPWKKVVFDNGMPTIAGPGVMNLAIMRQLKGDEELVEVEKERYGIKCSSPSDVKPLSFTFNGYTMTAPPEEFIEYRQGYCIFLFEEETVPAMILGGSFLRGNKIIYDQAGQRMGFFPQASNLIKEASISE